MLNCDLIDADDYHPQSNKGQYFIYFHLLAQILNGPLLLFITEKMRQGIPLTEEDRIPWLEKLRDILRESIIRGKSIVLGCSALQKQYREILRSADWNYKSGSYASCLEFILLDIPTEVLVMRLEKRAAEGKHFMPSTLLQSQLDLLQIDDSEGIYKVDGTLRPDAVVNSIQSLIRHSS